MELLRFNFYVAHSHYFCCCAAPLWSGCDETIGACRSPLPSANEKPRAAKNDEIMEKEKGAREMSEKFFL